MVTGFGLSCPSGGSFYICQDNATEFVGCCTTNPCADGKGNCPKANLRVASFSSDYYDEIPAQQCSSSDRTALWYTCAKNSPPFIGCCASNPCSAGSCSSNNLVAARLSSDKSDREEFILMGKDPVTTSSSTTASSTSTSSPTGSLTSSPSPVPSDAIEAAHAPLSTGAIIGIAAGAGAVVLAFVAFILYRRWSNKREDRRSDSATPFITGGMAEYRGTPEPAFSPKASPGLYAQPSPESSVFGLQALPPSRPESQQNLYPGYNPRSPPNSPPLSGRSGHMRDSSRFSELSGVSSASIAPISELETVTPLMMSELPDNGTGSRPGSHPGTPSLRPTAPISTPPRWNIPSDSNELKTWGDTPESSNYKPYRAP
ncbi:hypothetical protein OQA88_9911 [Cercophora sp. LCS_1]